MNILSYGGGTNSTAMLIGLRDNKIPLDLILFADTGAERPETYNYIENVMQPWLKENRFPPITYVQHQTTDGEPMTLETELLERKALPAIVYGVKSCSDKYKIRPVEKFCKAYKNCIDVWDQGGKINRFIGYDADEPNRRQNAVVYDMVNKQFKNHYPLVDDWDWGREECVEVIRKEGLPSPGKSSCFFCPSMKKNEIRLLYGKHRDLYNRAVAIEDNAQETLKSIKGLGRDWRWKDFVEAEARETAFCEIFQESNMPCGCYDG